MGVDETIQRECAWEQRAPDTEPWETLKGRRKKGRRKSQRLVKRTSRSRGPRDSRKGSNEPGEWCTRPTEVA